MLAEYDMRRFKNEDLNLPDLCQEDWGRVTIDNVTESWSSNNGANIVDICFYSLDEKIQEWIYKMIEVNPNDTVPIHVYIIEADGNYALSIGSFYTETMAMTQAFESYMTGRRGKMADVYEKLFIKLILSEEEKVELKAIIDSFLT